MNYYQMEIFITVVEQGSFSKSADVLYISSTAIMKQINLLESQLDIKLLNRNSKGITLTDAGKSFYNDIKEINTSYEDAVERAKFIEEEASNTIRIGTSILNPIKSFIPLWNKISKIKPKLNLQVVPFDDSQNTIISIIKNLGTDFDCFFGVNDSKKWKKYSNFLKLRELKLNCAVPRDHKLINNKMIRMEDLHGESLMIGNNGDSFCNDKVREYINSYHPQIKIIDIPTYYGLDTFNLCVQRNMILLSLDIWKDIHPLLINIPLEWSGKKTIVWSYLCKRAE